MKHKTKYGKSTKITFLFCLSFAIVLIVSIYASSLVYFSVRTMEYNIECRLVAESRRLAGTVSAEELGRYRKVEDMELPEYKALRQKLLAFSREADLLYTYFIRPTRDSLQYIVDNDFDEKTRVGLDTKPYPAPSEPWIIPVMDGHATCSGLGHYTQDWIGLISGYAPIFDKDGRIVAIAGVDIRDEPIVRARSLVYILIIVEIISIVVVFVSGVMCLVYFNREAKNAKEANLSKSRVFSQMSHEIRTPSLINDAVNPQLLKYFCNDAEKAIVTLRESVDRGDVKTFTITVHAMKSALANVGENEASDIAGELEAAGHGGDMKFISARIGGFIQSLESLIDKFNRTEKYVG